MYVCVYIYIYIYPSPAGEAILREGVSWENEKGE